MLNQQDLFNKAYLGVIAQGALSKTPDGLCLYRGPNGTKCAVGHLVDDDTAHTWDGSGDEVSIEYIFDRMPETVPEELRPHGDFLDAMQMAHDLANSIPEFIERMTKVATRYKLEMPQ